MNNNTRKIPNISNLHAERLVKEHAKNEIFTIVLNKCIEQIMETNSRTEHTFIYFEVPNIIIGFPGYDRLACVHFLIQELTKENFFHAIAKEIEEILIPLQKDFFTKKHNN